MYENTMYMYIQNDCVYIVMAQSALHVYGYKCTYIQCSPESLASVLLTVWKQMCLRDDRTSIHYTKKATKSGKHVPTHVHVHVYIFLAPPSCIPNNLLHVHVYTCTCICTCMPHSQAAPLFARGSGGALGVKLTMPVSREVASLRDLFSRASSTNPPPVASMVERLAFSLVAVMADDDEEGEGEGEEGGGALVVSDGSN